MIDVCCAFSRFGIVFFIVISPCFLFLRRQFGDVSRPWWKPNQSPLPWQSFNKPGNWPSPRTKLPRWHFCRHFPLCAGEGSSGKWCFFFFSNLFLVFLGGSRCLSFVYESKALPCWKSPTEFWARLTSRSKSRWRLKTSRRFVCLSKCFCKAETKKDKGIDAVQLLAQFLFLEGVPMMVNQIRGVGLSPKTFPKLDRLTRVGSFLTWCLDLLDLLIIWYIYICDIYEYIYIYMMIFDILTHINWDDLHEKMFGVSHHSAKIRDFRLRVGSIAAAVFMVLWIIASTVVSAVFTVRYMGIVEDWRHTQPWEDGRRFPRVPWCQEDQAWYLLEGSARTAAAEAQSIMEAATQVGEIGQISRHMLTNRCWVEPTLIFTGEICLDLRHRLWSHQNQLWLCCNWKHSGAHHGLVARSHQWNDIMISWYQRPNIYAWHAKKTMPRTKKQQTSIKILHWGNLTCIPSIWSSLTALRVLRLVIAKRSGLLGR